MYVHVHVYVYRYVCVCVFELCVRVLTSLNTYYVFITCIQFIVTSVIYRKDLSLPSLQLAAIARAFAYVRLRVQTYLGSS